MKLQLLSIPLLVALMLSPLVATAATGSITFSSPTSGQAFTGTAAYTISGTIAPVPSGPDNVFIVVNLQGSSQALDAQNVAVQSGGAFSYTTNVGGNSAWITGTYVITATDSNGATGTTTFTYTATGVSTPGSAKMIDILVAANTPVYSGQTVNIEAMLIWSTNGTLVTATNTTISATLQPPTGASSSLGAPSSTSTRGQYYWTTTLPAGSADGAYFIQVLARHGPSGSNSIGWGLGSFTVNSAIAPTSAITSLAASITGLQTSIASVGKNLTTWGSGVTTSLNGITSSLSAITSSIGTISTSLTTVANNAQAAATAAGSASSAVASLQNSVNTLSASVTSITGSLTTLQNDVSGLMTSVSGLSSIATNVASLQTSVNNLNSTVSNDQTYILVVAALAVITLVLELAILIRKMS